MDIIIQFVAKFPFQIKKQKKWVIASCPVLDIYSQGENEKKAKKNLVEAISLFFISCYERGTLDEALKECGFKLHSYAEIQKLPKTKESRKDYINVPLPFIVSQSREVECHA